MLRGHPRSDDNRPSFLLCWLEVSNPINQFVAAKQLITMIQPDWTWPTLQGFLKTVPIPVQVAGILVNTRTWQVHGLIPMHVSLFVVWKTRSYQIWTVTKPSPGVGNKQTCEKMAANLPLSWSEIRSNKIQLQVWMGNWTWNKFSQPWRSSFHMLKATGAMWTCKQHCLFAFRQLNCNNIIDSKVKISLLATCRVMSSKS